MAYKVQVTKDAQADVDAILRYLIVELQNEQAARTFMQELDFVIGQLSSVAGSLRLCESTILRELGYRRINFKKQRYFAVYRIIRDEVFTEKIFHELQDYENLLSTSLL